MEHQNVFKDNNDHIKEILDIDPDKRSEYHINVLMQKFGDDEFLIRFKETGQLKELWKYFRWKQFIAKTTIYEQNSKGTSFYIILSGRVILWRAYEGFLDEEKMQRCHDLSVDCCFGQAALTHENKREFKAVAEVSTDCLVLDKKYYDQVVKSGQNQIQEEFFEFLKSFPMFFDVLDATVNLIAQESQLRRYGSNEIILSQGDYLDYMYFIYTGQVELYRQINLQGFNQEIKVETLKGGQSIGDYSVFHQKPMHFTVVTTMPTTLLLWDVAVLQKLTTGALSEVKNECIPYEADEQLLDTYRGKQKWSSYQQRVSRSVRTDHRLKRTSFDQSLRKPVVLPDKRVSLWPNATCEKIAEKAFPYSLRSQPTTAMPSPLQSPNTSRSYLLPRQSTYQNVRQSSGYRTLRKRIPRRAKMRRRGISLKINAKLL